MKTSTPGRLSGVGTITRADGTTVEFTIDSEVTKEQAERLEKQAAKHAAKSKEKK